METGTGTLRSRGNDNYNSTFIWPIVQLRCHSVSGGWGCYFSR